jgi:hypothetical protein
MSAEEPQTFHIKKNRTLLELFKEPFHLIIFHLPSLTEALSLYTLPLVFISLWISHLIANPIAFLHNISHYKDSVSKTEFIFLIVGLITYVGSFYTASFIINRYMLFKDERSNETGKTFLVELKKNFFSQIKGYFFNFLIIYILYYILNFSMLYVDKLFLFNEYGDFGLDSFNSILNWPLQHITLIILLPLLMYFSFAALFVSVKENIGSSDALVKIYTLSKNNLLNIWLYSAALLLLIGLCEWALNYQINSLIGYFPFNLKLFFFFILIKKILAFTLLVFLQIATVLLFGHTENIVRDSEDNLQEQS